MKFSCVNTEGAQLTRKVASVACLVLASIALSMPAYAIQDGRLDGEDHPYVGMIAFYDAENNYLWRCSGTLIAPNVVLTAAHCAAEPAARAQVFFQSDLTGINHTVPGNEIGHMGIPMAHPGFEEGNFSSPDIGVIILDHPVEGIEPATVTGLGTLNGLVASKGSKPAILDIVGYGLQYIRRTPKTVIKIQADRVRHQGEVTLQNIKSALAGDRFVQISGDQGQGNGEGAICFGDSGGPIFLQGTNEIVAVNSFVLNFQAVGPGFGYRTDTEEAHDFIDFMLELAESDVP
jgi:secreted trypsin-like serine protease